MSRRAALLPLALVGLLVTPSSLAAATVPVDPRGRSASEFSVRAVDHFDAFLFAALTGKSLHRRRKAAPAAGECGASACVDVTTDISEAEWDGFLADRPEASIYHLWRWRRVFERAFGHETVYLAAHDGDKVVGVLPLVIFQSGLFGRFAVSLPFVSAGGVCAIDEGVGRALVDRASELAVERDLAHVEFRHAARRFPELPARTHKVAMRRPLEPDIASAWNALDRKVRNLVLKAQKQSRPSLTCRSGGRELLKPFYAVFAQNMRDLGTPVYSIKLFEDVLELFPQAARVFLIDRGDRTVAGGFTLSHRNTLEVPWASSLRRFRHESVNYLLYWKMTEYAVARGYTVFDFGRSSPNDGPYTFKRHWGGEPEPLHWEYALVGRTDLPNLSPSNRRFRAAIEAWKRLPLAVTNLLGPRIVRSIP